MRALVCTNPGMLEYRELNKPDLMKDQAIIKIRRIGICGTDLHAYEGTQPYFNYPRILGHELSGDLVDIGSENGEISKGDSVTVIPYFYCGQCIACRQGKSNCCATLKVAGVHIDGGMTEYLSVPAYSLVDSNGLDYDSLSIIEPLAIGAHGIRRAGIKPAEMVLIMGAGPIGLATMQFAIIAGAEVIAMDINRSRLQFCRDILKITHTINPKDENVTDRLRSITNGDMPAVVIDATGNQDAINNGLDYLSFGGRYILVGLQKDNIVLSHPEFHKREATLMSSRNATRADFDYVIKNIKNGLVDPISFITHRVKFGQVKNEFESWLDPSNGVIKAIVEFD
jgi:2-desacetyl-2-hydroxyethyl bacteriochlorophyllide A dehydrogenase